MAPCTVCRLARRMAHGSHIHHENYEFIGVGGPVPTSTYGHVLDLYFRDLDPMVYNDTLLELPSATAS